MGAPDSSVAEVYRQHGAYVWRALRYLGVAECDVADVSQEVFLVVHAKLSTFEGRSRLTTWLYGICLRKAARYRTRRRRYEHFSADLTEGRHAPTTAGEQGRVDARQQLVALLERLDPKQREVLVLYEIEDLTLQQVAEAVGSPVQTVYSRLLAARKAAARIVGDETMRSAR